MQHFVWDRVDTLAEAAQRAARPGAAVVAGATTVSDLMKLGVLEPSRLVDITRIDGIDRIEETDHDIRFGALVRMADAAEHETLKIDYPALSEALWRAASPQLRNAARLGGNVLQRTRCPYFRDTDANCNKREPGSGCGAIDGWAGMHAVLGTSEQCIALYPGDWAVALSAFDAEVEIIGPDGPRALPFEDLHRLPGDTPNEETTLGPGDIITAIRVAKTPRGRASTYHKVRDRESYAFAAASAAVAVELAGNEVADVRIALGGVATKPWRAREAEAALKGRRLTEDAAQRAGEAAFADAVTRQDNAWKVPLGIATVSEALMIAKARV